MSNQKRYRAVQLGTLTFPDIPNFEGKCQGLLYRVTHDENGEMTLELSAELYE